MFDPSKLDLDLDNKDNKQEKKLDENSPKEEKTIENNSVLNKETKEKEIIETKKEENDDILNDVKIEENIQKSTNKEINKDSENTQEQDENEKTSPQPSPQGEGARPENEKNEEIQEKIQEEKKVIYDINITSLKDVLYLLVDNEYDFWILEPNDENIRISLRKNKVEKDVKYIKFPIYSQILIKAKSIAKLNIEENSKEQEWTWEVTIRSSNHKLILKTVPSDFWEKIFLKVELIQKKAIKKVKKTSLSQIMWFIWALALIWLLVWGAFTTYIVLNAKTIADVQFFYSLWINLNDINTFITKVITIIFSILMFFETIFLIMFLFKFILTKKEFKQKKIKYWIFSVIFFIICFATASTWMFIDQKVKSLPNWQEMAYWEVQIYDNLKLKSDSFDKWWSLLQDTSNLIWPVEIKFDLSYFASKEEQNWLQIKKFIWDFWDGELFETPNSSLIKNFDEKWIYEISLIVQEIDLKWDLIEKIVENIPTINISYLVKQNEKRTENWWKIVDFDANDLKELWKIEWYFIDNLEKPVFEWYTFYMWKAIFKETLIWMYIQNNDKENKTLDKIFIINWDEKTNLDWKITNIRSIENDLEYELKVENINIDSWNWYIEEYKWIIEDKEITKIWNIENPTKSSLLIYEFKEYWEHNIKVILKNSSWEIKELTTIIDIPKQLDLSKSLNIYNNDELIENIEYESKLNEYFINEIWVPTTLKLDARFLKASNNIYTLDSVNWDFNSDWDIDESNKLAYYEVDIEWNHTITVEYIFMHRTIKDDIIKVQEVIYIEWIKKEAIINFDIKKSDNYAPIIVTLDASKSIVKDENIVKFVWDYWDWVVEERDSIVPGHKYLVAGDYIIKLKVITESWKEYETSKKLILKPKPQNIKISTSMKKTIVWQWIDFSSKESEWQIISYLWKFGDWSTSTQANPTHSYNKTWEYTVELQGDFDNNNFDTDIIKIEIVNEY